MGRRPVCDPEVVLDAFACNLPLMEISRSLGGIPIGTLGSIIHRARKEGDPRAGLRRRVNRRVAPAQNRPSSPQVRRHCWRANFLGARTSSERRSPAPTYRSSACAQASRPAAGDQAGCALDASRTRSTVQTKDAVVHLPTSQWSSESLSGRGRLASQLGSNDTPRAQPRCRTHLPRPGRVQHTRRRARPAPSALAAGAQTPVSAGCRPRSRVGTGATRPGANLRRAQSARFRRSRGSATPHERRGRVPHG